MTMVLFRYEFTHLLRFQIGIIMHLQNTPYSARSGIKIFKFDSNLWRHVTTHDADNHDPDLPYKGQVGPAYTSKKDLLADHVPYLLRAGWLKLVIDLPEPKFTTAAVAPNLTVYGWAMEDNVIGIRVYGESKIEVISIFKDAVEREYGNAVTIKEPEKKRHLPA